MSDMTTAGTYGTYSPMTTKAQVRADFTYTRELMRQAEVALKNDDIDELSILAHELSGSVATVFQYMVERGGAY